MFKEMFVTMQKKQFLVFYPQKHFLHDPATRSNLQQVPLRAEADGRCRLLLAQFNPFVFWPSIPNHADTLWKAPGHLLAQSHTNLKGWLPHLATKISFGSKSWCQKQH